MKRHNDFFATSLPAMLFLLLLSGNSMAQAISGVDATPPDPGNSDWIVGVAFVPAVPQSKIKQIFLINVDEARIIQLSNPTAYGHGIYSYKPSEPLQTVQDPTTHVLSLAHHYELKASVENLKGDKILSLGAEVEFLDPAKVATQEERIKAKNAEDSDVYIAGELNGAHKTKTSFTTEIKLQRYQQISPNWRYTPFFKLNASTDSGADPDKLEGGLNVRYILSKTKAYFDNAIKLESERDFDNTNFIYDTRLTFLPSSFPKGFKKKDAAGKITTTNFKVFFNPYIGGEFGKNLRSPLKAAEGDGIARLLAGADLRFAFFIKKNQKAPDINWTLSYTRRWLLSDELRFKADDDGVLQLRSFGKSPRDRFSSKVSYRLSPFFDIFTEYEWGEVPPSYKLVDHRFRLGFAYKFKFGLN